MKELSRGIIIDSTIKSGQPIIMNTRIPVLLVLGKLAGGASYEELIEEYGITKEDILNSLNYALEVLSSEEIKAVL